MGLQELALLLLFSLPLCSAQNTYYVLPTPDTPCSAPEPEGCCVLSECVEQSDRYFASNTTLVFLHGSHILSTSLHVEGVNNLTLIGDSSFLPEVTSTITCIGDPVASFLFNETLGLTITALAFDSCGSGVSAGVSLMSVSDSRITNCVFQNSNSDIPFGASGGALLLKFGSGTIVISDCIFENNSALLGGGVFISDNSNSEVSFIRNHFVNNTAGIGGGLFLQSSTVALIGNSFVSNTASELGTGGGVVVLNCDISIWGETVFLNNAAEVGFGGGLYVETSDVVFFSGDTNFENNSALLLGGATMMYNSTVVFKGGTVRLESNHADYGAAAAVIQSDLITERSTCFQNNQAVYGAGIYSREANLTFNGDTTFCNNRANFGGAIYASSSNLNFNGCTNVTQNSAIMDGGGLLLTDGSTMHLFPSTELYFIHNHARETGGAIKVLEDTPLAYCYRSASSLTTVVAYDCFFQLQNQTVSDVSAVITFENNTAALGGSDLYGGAVDSCRLRNIGFDVSGEVFDCVTGSELQPLSISSDPLRVCLCTDNIPSCDDSFIPVEAYPGQSLQISATTFGQRNGSTAGVIRAQLLHGSIQFGDLENIQRTNNTCTNLRYTLFTSPQNHTEEITLFAEGPCQREGRSLVVRVSILPCPPGFQQSELVCVCDERLNDFTKTCNIDNRTILRPRGAEFWVGYDNNSQELILNSDCPFDYCSSHESFIEVNDSDTQCNYNRSGVLCGGCSGTTSLVLGSSRCMQCSSSYVALIIVFAVAGIAIVVILFILKLTVAVGTINGLIFYANLVQVNSSIFYPPGTTNILTVFIAWINLDLGIETCLYNGMDAYAKTWLQFVFPIYVWALVGLIILSSHYSQKMTNLLGSNPIAVLATLLLLSYAKVLRTIIAALSFTYLRYPRNVNVAVWSIDGNIEYLTGKHIPLFLIALLALLLLFLPYTLFLFLAQWMQTLQGKLEWRIFSWLSKPSVRALLDAYHAPYVNQHRYWTGLLLLIRCVLFLVFATAGDSSANLLAITSVITGLISFALTIYKSWYLGALEMSLLLNLVILSGATYHIKVSGGNQAAVTFFLLSIAFITFVGIIVFHIFLQISKTLASRWKRFSVKHSPDDIQTTSPVTSSKSILTVIQTKEEAFQNTESETSMYAELREPLLDES